MKIDCAPWSRESTVFQQSAAASAVLASCFILPSLLFVSFGNRISGASIMFISSLSGLTALLFLPPEKCGLRRLCLRDILITVLITAAAILFSGFATSHWQNFLTANGISFAPKQAVLVQMKTVPPRHLLMLIAGTCLITPLIEEILFRRVIYGALLKMGMIPAFLLTSLLFGAAHFFLAGIPGLTILGMGFHLSFLLTGNLSAAVLSHLLVNTLATLSALH
ncbi:MAG: CPBP family intramembrane metalloprotease [Lentisphaeria bacterium]|nr:CPBP family intramembrane metalloprotease [Lentisphaeria bacterium]